MFHKLLIAYFGAFSIFWILGIDQLFFFFICAFGFFCFFASERTAPDKQVIWFAVFIIMTFFSFLQIKTGDRYVTYIRNELVYVAMLCVMVSSIFASAHEGNTTDKLYFALLLFGLQCSLVAFLASNGHAIAFKSLAGYVLPDMGSKYIRGMLVKNSIQAEALWFSQGFIRPRGLMLYPNTMAGVLASTMAFKAYFFYKFWRDGFPVFAIICVAAIYMDIFSIYSSLSRSTWIGMVFAIGIFPFVYKTKFSAKLIPLLVGVLVIALVFASGLNEGITSRLVDKGHSNEGRGLNYLLIWQYTTGSIDKLLIGHGTQIDHPLLGIPLGSHSTYLGVFFKFGVLGSIAFVLFLFILYRRSVDLTKNVIILNAHGAKYIRPYFLCFALITPIVQMSFIEVDVDVSYGLYFATLAFLIGQETRLVNARIRNLLTSIYDPGYTGNQSSLRPASAT